MRKLSLILLMGTAAWAADDPVMKAVEKSLERLQTSAVEFTNKSGCISCHHQTLTAFAVAAARDRGMAVDEKAALQQVKFTAAVAAPHRETMLQGIASIPASTIVSSYTLLGLAAEKYPADEMTAALIHELASRQDADGRWRTDNGRPPLDQGEATSTALTMRALQLYPIEGRKQEFQYRVKRAAQWLARYKPATTQEQAMRLLGLAWAGTEYEAMREAAAELTAAQRADGGWAQLKTLESDAYATGQALYALQQSNVIKTTDAVYQGGVEYLLRTQKGDGTWHVKSRALGFQRYFESGYPYGHDQWISAAGAGWATLALALTKEPAMAKR